MSFVTGHASGNPQPRRIFVFDSPRTCSHLLRKLFLYHPQLGHILEPYLVPSIFTDEGVTDSLQCTPAAWEVIAQGRKGAPELTKYTYSVANGTLGESLKDLEQKGKIPWIKDHAIYSVRPEIILSTLRSNASVLENLEKYPNPTLIDDTLLHSFTPIFLIRHPILVMRSYWEVNLQSIGSGAKDEQFAWMTSVRWVRILFDYYRKQNHDIPLVVDADDVVRRTAELTDQICDRLGIDKTGVAFDWEPEAAPGQLGDFFKTRIRSSKGVERASKEEAQKQHDINDAFTEWSTKYGMDTANALKRRVEEEMPDYEYLQQFRLLS